MLQLLLLLRPFQWTWRVSSVVSAAAPAEPVLSPVSSPSTQPPTAPEAFSAAHSWTAPPFPTSTPRLVGAAGSAALSLCSTPRPALFAAALALRDRELLSLTALEVANGAAARSKWWSNVHSLVTSHLPLLSVDSAVSVAALCLCLRLCLCLCLCLCFCLRLSGASLSLPLCLRVPLTSQRLSLDSVVVVVVVAVLTSRPRHAQRGARG